MESLVQPDRLRARIRAGELPPKSGSILEAVLYRGELPRCDAGAAVGTGERQARRISFPATLASRWMPGLFPEQAD